MTHRLLRLDLTPAALPDLLSGLRRTGTPFMLVAPGEWDRPSDAVQLLTALNRLAFHAGPETARHWLPDALLYLTSATDDREWLSDLTQVTRSVCELARQVGGLPAGYHDLLQCRHQDLSPDDLLTGLMARAFRDGDQVLMYLRFPSGRCGALVLPPAAVPPAATPV